MSIKTDKKTQLAILSFFKAQLKKKKINIIKSGRHGPHLRFPYKGDLKKLLNSITPCKIEPSNIRLSGTYETQVLTLSKSLSGIKGGEQIYVVHTSRSNGVIAPKLLTPHSLKINGKTIKKSKFLKTVTATIREMKIEGYLKTFLISLMNASNKDGVIDANFNKISQSDLNVISKDFGEISSALWFMNQKKADSITYPEQCNLKLIDYYAKKGNRKICVSAKSNYGSPPSIDTIAEVLKDMRYGSRNKETARKAIISISQNGVVDGILEASKNIKLEGYEYLNQNVFMGDFDAKDCETYMSTFKSPLKALNSLEPYYELMGRSASDMIAKRIFKNKSKRFGLIISPMGYSLVDELNLSDQYVEVLNDAAKKMNVTQVYMTINRTQKYVKYSIKKFDQADFRFYYNANAGLPALKKISFRMNRS